MATRALRIGIDVGGTFTDVVAIDAANRKLIAKVKVPTTHDAPEGVAAGIVCGIERLLSEGNLSAGEVAFIAHSTTQATNALLEGDVAAVGVVGLLSRWGGIARRMIRFAPVPLAPERELSCRFYFAAAREPGAMQAAVDRALADGAQAVAVTQAFAVDDPSAELAAVRYACERGADATSGHDVSAMYGLRARTRTAALNAAILPKMVKTSRMTQSAVERSAIPAPLMVMRSDGGVMAVAEIARRPILTLLSGPAAGVAGALLHEHVADGIFVEVGGTSSDLSTIRAGRPQMRPAQIGGHRTMLRTLDVRTLGIAGGSMVRLGERGVADVGPRSAHIAGCAYACFTAPQAFDDAVVETMAPCDGDPNDYAVILASGGRRIAITTTCAANALGEVPAGTFATGNAQGAKRAFALLAERTGVAWDELARATLEIAARKLQTGIEELIADYALDPAHVMLVGGGGGSGSIVPYTARRMNVPYRIARDAEVIAPVGVALALVRDVVERTILAPTPGEIASIRREAIDRVIAAGAAPDRVEAVVEIDAQRSRVRATASGATALAGEALEARGEADCREAAAAALRCAAGALVREELTPEIAAYRSGTDVALVDRRGSVRSTLRDATLLRGRASDAPGVAGDAVEEATRFGDVGRSLPALYLVCAGRVAAYEGLVSAPQAVELVREELAGSTGDEPVALFTVKPSTY
jgi:N-methylhydantoinase A